MTRRPASMLKLKVVTLNTWGLWLLSKRREERMRALAAWLRAGAEEADVVTLQEVRTSQGWGGGADLLPWKRAAAHVHPPDWPMALCRFGS